MKALIVDDDPRFRRRLAEFLSEQTDVEVVSESMSGEEAIMLVRALKPDLVLMDIRLPGMNGLEAIRWIKIEMPHVEVIVLTTFELEEYRQEALAVGADAFVVKRRMLKELIPAIGSLS